MDIHARTLKRLPVWGKDREAQDIELKPGGSAANVARHLGSLRKDRYEDVLFFSTIGGMGIMGSLLLNRLADEGFLKDVRSTVKILPRRTQSVCVVLSGEEDRAMVTSYASLHGLDVEYLESHIHRFCKAEAIFLGGFFNCRGLHRASFVEFVRRVRRENEDVVLALDPQFDSTGRWDANGIFDEILTYCDVFLPNDIEAREMAKTDDAREALDALVRRYPKLLVVVTCGSDGVLAGKGSRRWSVAACKVDVVDATGAGDAFSAGFLFRYLQGGTDRDVVAEALRYGVASGTVAVSSMGACEKPLDRSALNDTMKN